MKDLIIFLENYNKWRRGNENIEMPNQKKIGENIDKVIKILKEIK